MQTKSDLIRSAWAAGDKRGAMRIAAKFFDRSPETLAIKRGWDAISNADFYRQIGKDPQQLFDLGCETLAAKLRL